MIDWDYFFEMIEPGHPRAGHDPIWTLYDWGHKENSFFIEAMWQPRAATFLSHGLSLPGTTGREHTFWQRFNISKQATLYYAESNVMACTERVRRGVRGDVWLYDAHHDSGGYDMSACLADVYKRGTFDCESWMLAYWLRARLHMRYPKWKAYGLTHEPTPIIDVERAVDDDAPNPTYFSRVFVCRSGAWVPTWLDDAFFDFIERAPVKRRVAIGGPVERRAFSFEHAHEDAERMREHRERTRKHGSEPQSNTEKGDT